MLASSSEDGTCALWAEGQDNGPERVWHLSCPSADRVCIPSAGEGESKSGSAWASVVQHLAVEPRERDGERDGERHSRLAAAAGSSVFVLAREEAEPLTQLRAVAAVTGLEYAPIGRRLCAASYGGISVWEEFGLSAVSAAGPALVLPFSGLLGSVAVAADEHYIASGAHDSTLVVWPFNGRGDQRGACGEQEGHEGQEWLLDPGSAPTAPLDPNLANK